jgi:hypothetical protein
MKSLTLRFIDLITHTGIQALLKSMPTLEGLDISGCFNVGLSGVLATIRSINSKKHILKSLIIEYLPITDMELKYLADS